MLRQQNKTRAPIRRNSGARGECERALWAPTSRRELNEIIRACERAEFSAWLARDPSRGVGRTGLAILRELARLTCWKTGRLEVAYQTIADRLGIARSTVSRALARLRANGWLRSQRRVDRAPEGATHRWVQIANAFALAIPKALAAVLKPPMPDDIAHHRAAQARTRLDYERQADPHTSALETALARLRRAIDADHCEAEAGVHIAI